MLRPEKANAHTRAAVIQSLALQGLLAAIIIIAALFSRDKGIVFWLTLALLAVPLSIGTVYVRALVKMGRDRNRQAR